VPPLARILQGPTNLRVGPGTGFTVLAVGNEGDQYTVSGRSEDSRWIQLCCVSGAAVWVATSLAELPAAAETFPIVR
jgi:uncharacterized protein YgiM (DUF1202 family)